eukprot:gene6737-9101_t
MRTDLEELDELLPALRDSAGALFAAGFLRGQAQGKSLEESLRLGAICAAEIISHYGARPMCDMQALVAEKLG